MEDGLEPRVLLEFLQGAPDMKAVAVEQLCMALLLADNSDVVLQRLPPAVFLFFLMWCW